VRDRLRSKLLWWCQVQGIESRGDLRLEDALALVRASAPCPSWGSFVIC